MQAVGRSGVLIDSRKRYVRVGFGFGHSLGDVEALLKALGCAKCACSGSVGDGNSVPDVAQDVCM